jgi:hypothetical protein
MTSRHFKLGQRAMSVFHYWNGLGLVQSLLDHGNRLIQCIPKLAGGRWATSEMAGLKHVNSYTRATHRHQNIRGQLNLDDPAVLSEARTPSK